MELATLQRRLYDLLKGTGDATEESEYLCMVSCSDNLRLVQEIDTWWRIYSLEQACVLTTRLLRRLGVFEEEALAFIAHRSISPFYEEVGRAFLDTMSRHRHELVVAVARFESALLHAKAGAVQVFAIPWAYEPYGVLDSLINGGPLPDRDTQGFCYRVLVSREMPQHFRVEHVGPTGLSQSLEMVVE